MKCVSKFAICAAALPLLLVIGAWAQINGGSIVGSVLDSSGPAISAPKVTATNVATNEGLNTVTNETGYFEFPLLPAGPSVLGAANPGFHRSRSAASSS